MRFLRLLPALLLAACTQAPEAEFVSAPNGSAAETETTPNTCTVASNQGDLIVFDCAPAQQGDCVDAVVQEDLPRAIDVFLLQHERVLEDLDLYALRGTTCGAIMQLRPE